MKLFKTLTVVAVILASSVRIQANDDRPVVIAMTSPTVKQIKNIETLYEKDLLAIKKIKLIGIFHKDEKTDYSPAEKYIKENSLTWVSFLSIEGIPPVDGLFKKNIWTTQFRNIFEMSQGIIFTGGEDIPPQIYENESNLLTDASTPIRSYFECSFLFHLLGGKQNPAFIPFLKSNDRFVILAICLGAQTLNVASGGTILQDIPTEVYGHTTIENVLASEKDSIHSSLYLRKLHPLEDDLAPFFHRIKFLNKPKFLKHSPIMISDHPLVLSSHHQAIRELGRNLEIVATSMDGKIPEIIQHTTFENVLAVQFHPEYSPLFQKGKYFKAAPGSPADLNLSTFLSEHPPSMSLHIHLWKWFSEALTQHRRPL